MFFILFLLTFMFLNQFLYLFCFFFVSVFDAERCFCFWIAFVSVFNAEHSFRFFQSSPARPSGSQVKPQNDINNRCTQGVGEGIRGYAKRPTSTDELKKLVK